MEATRAASALAPCAAVAYAEIAVVAISPKPKLLLAVLALVRSDRLLALSAAAANVLEASEALEAAAVAELADAVAESAESEAELAAVVAELAALVAEVDAWDA